MIQSVNFNNIVQNHPGHKFAVVCSENRPIYKRQVGHIQATFLVPGDKVRL